MHTIPTIKNLVLGSGGLCGLSYLGILRYFQEQNIIENLKHIYGVSIGAFFGFLFAINIDYDMVEKELKGFYTDHQTMSMPYHSVYNIKTDYGVDKGDRLVQPLKNIYAKYYHSLFPKKSYDINKLTFLDFVKHTGKTLTVVATNLTTNRPEFFSVDRTPKVCIWNAIQASMTIPWIFQPVKIGHHLYIDGYITCEYPSPTPDLLDKSCTLGVFIKNSYANSTSPTSLFSYSIKILETIVFYPKEMNRIQDLLDYSIILDENPIDFFPVIPNKDGFILHILPHDIDLSIGYGYQKMYDFIFMYNQKIISEREDSFT